MLAIFKQNSRCVLLSLAACCFAVLLLAGCSPHPRKADNQRNNPLAMNQYETLQSKNITPALPGFKVIEPSSGFQQEENASDLSKRIKSSPDGIAVSEPEVIEPAITVEELPLENGITPPASIKAPLATDPSASLPSIVAAEPEDNPPFKPVKIAFLLPLSGTNAPIGKSIQSAAELAWYELGKTTKALTILTYDTKGTAEGATAAINQATDQGVDMVFGPLTQPETEAVAETARQRKIPLISLSGQLALAGDGVYVFGYNIMEQTKRVVEYAYSTGVRKFSALLPENEFGISAMDAVSDTLKRKNTAVKRVEYYKDDEATLNNALQRISYNDPSMPMPKPASEALVVPEGGKMLYSITSKLFKRGMTSQQFRLLGSAEWDDPLIINEPMLNGAWFATLAPDASRDFSMRFRKVNGYEPIRLASLGYDAIAMTLKLAANDVEKRFTVDTITDPNGFKGAAGMFRISKINIAQRSLAVVEVSKGKLSIIDPAPTIFKNSVTAVPRL